ncbi:MAG: hypothetical protein U0263_27255 [Polyangiaceae bacterium]
MGLYDDDNNAVTSGDQNDKEYWYSKAHAEALDLALKQKQPEGAIKDFLAEAIKVHDAALAKFPNHAEVKAWKEKAETIKSKINPKAEWDRWKPDWPWDSPFLHGWVEYNWAVCARAAGDWATVYEQARAADNHLGDYGAKKHYKSWSEDLRAWVDRAYDHAKEIWEESRKHR